MLTCGDAKVAGTVRSERNQGRGRRHGLALARPARLQLPALRRRRRRWASRRSSASTPCWPSATAWPRSTASGWPASRGSCCPARTGAMSAAAGSSSWCSCPRRRPRRGDRGASRRGASPPRPTCRASTSSRSTASGSASAAGSSRSPSGWRRVRWRCRSSRRWGRPRWSGCAGRWRQRSDGSSHPPGSRRPVLSITCQPRRPGRLLLLCRAGAGSACSASWGWSPPVPCPRGLFRDLLAHLASSFQPDVNWLFTGASGFALMGVGLLASLPVVLSIGRTPDSRLYPRSRGLAGRAGA